jgi:hypothetical protein
MIPAAIHAPTPTIPKLCELVNDCVSLKAMTLPTMVSVALTKGITWRVFLPTIAEKFPFLGNHPICALPLLLASPITPPQCMQQAQHTRRERALHHSNAIFFTKVY